MIVRTVKKLAEVQAFVSLAPEIRQRGGEALAKQVPAVSHRLDRLGSRPALLVDEANRAVFGEKVKRTMAKLTTMMDLYVGDEWDNPVEVLEWLSFYAGAGAAHAALVIGAGRDDVQPVHDEFWKLLGEVKLALSAEGVALTKRAV